MNTRAKSNMRSGGLLGLLSLLVLVALFLSHFAPVYAASAEPLAGSLTIDKAQVKAGDLIHFSVVVKNTTNHDHTLHIVVPFVAYPSITDSNNKPANLWAPPVNGPATPVTRVLKPGESFTLLNYTVKIVEQDVSGISAETLVGMLAPSAGGANSGLLYGAPGKYTVAFKLTLGATLVEPPARSFAISP